MSKIWLALGAVLLTSAVTTSAQSRATLPAETLLDRAVLKALDEELSASPRRITSRA